MRAVPKRWPTGPAEAGRVLVLSDGTGMTAEVAVTAALVQFPDRSVQIRRWGGVQTILQVEEAVAEAARTSAFLVYSLVAEDLRTTVANASRRHRVPTLDLLGPLLDSLTTYLKSRPVRTPGLFRKLHKDYYARIEALEFTVQHDDGQRPGDLPKADLVLVGVSRTSKTPLSIYLAGRGWKVANVPIILGINPPVELFGPKGRTVGLMVKPGRLLEYRRVRVRQLKVGLPIPYADPRHVRAELAYARQVFRRGGFPIVDVTDKSLEETATEVVAVLHGPRGGSRTRPVP